MTEAADGHGLHSAVKNKQTRWKRKLPGFRTGVDAFGMDAYSDPAHPPERTFICFFSASLRHTGCAAPACWIRGHCTVASFPVNSEPVSTHDQEGTGRRKVRWAANAQRIEVSRSRDKECL